MPVIIVLLALLVLAAPTKAAGKTCFGKTIDRTVKTDRAIIKSGGVVWIEGDGITVIGKPYSTICAGAGDQTVFTGKGISKVSVGQGDDTVRLHPSSWSNMVVTGDGNDRVFGSRGHDIISTGDDRDMVWSGGGNDLVRDTGGDGNEIHTETGADKVWSLGGQGSVWGGNGSDFIYSNGGITTTGEKEQLFGERGNDRLIADYAKSDGPALLDPGPGDDWIRGTSFADTAIYQSGLKKVATGPGDDVLISSGRGKATVDGGEGEDTISFAAWTPIEGGYRSGLSIQDSQVRGLELVGWENIIGSGFDDVIVAEVGVKNTVWGGMGDDEIEGQESDRDIVFGGIGQNSCFNFFESTDCNYESRPETEGTYASLDISGVLVVKSGSRPDLLSIVQSGSIFTIESNQAIENDGLCASNGAKASCMNATSVIVYSGDGNDQISIESQSTITATLDGGGGINTIKGGLGKDTIKSLGQGSRLDGGENVDNIYIDADVFAIGGPGNDVIHSDNPCLGGLADGGPGRDNLVFAGATAGVWASIGKGQARFISRECEFPLSIDPSTESLEGSSYNDFLQIGPRFKEQEGPGQLLGREGIDTLDAQNGARDKITTGSNGKRNTVIRDQKDSVVWGWGLSGF